MLASLTKPRKLGGELVVAGGDASPLLELGEEALDAPTVFIGNAVISMLVFAVPAGRDDRFPALLVDEIVQTIGVIGAVGQNLLCGDATDEVAGGCHVVLLAGAEDEADWQAKRIDYGVDFGAEPAS